MGCFIDKFSSSDNMVLSGEDTYTYISLTRVQNKDKRVRGLKDRKEGRKKEEEGEEKSELYSD